MPRLSLLKNLFKIKYFILLLIISSLLFQTGCSKKSNDESSAKYSAKLAAFQLYVSGTVVAADRSNKIQPGLNCFENAGLNCQIIKRSKGPEVVDALVGGSADFGTLANTPVVLQALQGSNLVIFATIQTTNHDIKVVGHRSSGVTSGESLQGKKIGFVGGTIGEIFLDRYLEKYHIKKSNVNLLSAGPAQLRDLFFNKSLDAIIIWEPIIQDILRDKSIDRSELFLDVDTTLYVLRMHLVAKPKTLKDKKEAAKQLLKAMLCGEKLIKNYPNKVREQLELWLDRKQGTLQNVFDPSTFHVELDIPILKKELKEEAEWAKESVFSGKSEIPQDFSKYIDSSILEAIAPDRVIK